jgi:hypothetical protein
MGSPSQEDPERNLPSNDWVPTQGKLDWRKISERDWKTQIEMSQVAYVSV